MPAVGSPCSFRWAGRTGSFHASARFPPRLALHFLSATLRSRIRIKTRNSRFIMLGLPRQPGRVRWDRGPLSRKYRDSRPRLGSDRNHPIYEQHVLWAEYCRMMASLALKIPSHQTELDLPQADDVHVNDPAPIMRAADDTIELASMTFGFPPTGGMTI
jgi:hypothetical protein